MSAANSPAASPATKRQCTDRAIDPLANSGSHNYLPIIRSLPVDKLCSILAHAAQHYPKVAATIVNERRNIIKGEKAKEVDFDPYAKIAWKALNGSMITYEDLGGERVYEKSFEIFSKVQDCINAIQNGTPAHANLKTKTSALDALQRIGKAISLCDAETLGDEVRELLVKQFQNDDTLEMSMLRIVESIPALERYAFVKQEFGKKLVELEKLGNEHSLIGKLKDVRLALLTAKGFSDDEKEQEDEKDDEDYETESEESEESMDDADYEDEEG
ncbi:unnamed protein product [Calypogeia fissa]